MNLKKRFLSLFAIAGAIIIVASACSSDKNHPGYEFMPNMYRSAGYETYSESGITANGMSALTPVEGTVPRGFTPYEFGASNEEYERAGSEMSFPKMYLNAKSLEEGKELYNMFCMHCHGKDGAGDGQIIKNEKFPPPPSYANGNSSRGGTMADLTSGKIYHTIVYGLNFMGPHASQLSDEERWKIVLYVHQLQGKDMESFMTGTAPEPVEVAQPSPEVMETSVEQEAAAQ